MPTALIDPPAAPRPMADDIPLRFTVLDRRGCEIIHLESQSTLAHWLSHPAFAHPRIQLLEGYSVIVQRRKKRPHHEDERRRRL
jgi:hypothetical protein